MKRLSTRVIYFTYGAFLSLTLMAPLLPIWGVKPYTEVKLLEEVWTENGLTVRAMFTKNGQCKLVDFSVISFTSGVPRYVDYRDLDGVGDNYDRPAGSQALNIFVPVGRYEADSVELRTSHLCIADKEGHTITVTKVFSSHEPD